MARALIVADGVPAETGGHQTLAAWRQIEALTDAGWDVVCVCERAGVADLGAIGALAARGVETWAGSPTPSHPEPLDAVALTSPQRIVKGLGCELAVIHTYVHAGTWLPLLRGMRPRPRILIDASGLELLAASQRRFTAPEGQLTAIELELVEQELNSYAAADGILTRSEFERDLIDLFCPRPAPTWPMPVARAPASAPLEARSGIIRVDGEAPAGSARLTLLAAIAAARALVIGDRGDTRVHGLALDGLALGAPVVLVGPGPLGQLRELDGAVTFAPTPTAAEGEAEALCTEDDLWRERSEAGVALIEATRSPARSRELFLRAVDEAMARRPVKRLKAAAAV